MCEEYTIEVDNIIIHRDTFAASLVIHIIRNAILLEIWARRIPHQETRLSIMHLQRRIRTHTLCLLPCGFEEDLREAIQIINARAEGTLGPHSPVAEVEASRATLTSTTFPPNPRSTISNLVGLLATIQSASETTSAIMHNIQQSIETSREARQAITDIVNVLHDYPVAEHTPSPVWTVNPIHTLIQNQTTPPDYHRSFALSPEVIKTWTEEHPTGLYEPAPTSLPPVVVQLLEFVPVAALGATTPSSTEELIAAAEAGEAKPVLEPAARCSF
ncbi:hypothetical protein BDR04DRAFT_1150275 [Suillus decipiens]|nr:hypothetical protein BDR04DRAFT_1150275 [Suillus decipiens]